MKFSPTKSNALIKAIENHDYAAAKPLALELLPSLEYSTDFDENATYWLLSTITGEIDEAIRPNEFDFAKSLMEKAWSIPSNNIINFIRQGSFDFCERYVKELSESENIAMRNRAINHFDNEHKIFHLCEMIIYLLNNTEQYTLAWEKVNELEFINKSEALLFKSHMLRHGVGIKKNVFDAFIAEIQSVKFYNKSHPNSTSFFNYGEYYSIVDDSEFLFVENSSYSSFEMSRNGFVWYASQSKESDPFAVAIRELKAIGALDERRERLY